MISIDTNVITASATGDSESEDCIKEYLSKESNGNGFVTPKVVDECFDIGSKLTSRLFLIKKRMKQKEIGFKEAEKDLLDDFDGDIDGGHNSLFGNFTKYIAENAGSIEEVSQLEREIDRELSRFQHKKRKIRPPNEAIKEDKKDFIAKRETIEDKNLVQKKDVPIVMQLWRYYDLNDREIDLITNDDGDFRCSKNEWEMELSFLDVKIPEVFLSDNF